MQNGVQERGTGWHDVLTLSLFLLVHSFLSFGYCDEIQTEKNHRKTTRNPVQISWSFWLMTLGMETSVATVPSPFQRPTSIASLPKESDSLADIAPRQLVLPPATPC